MSGNEINNHEIKFTLKGKEVSFNVNGKKEGDGKAFKKLNPIFNAIANYHSANGKIDTDLEMGLLKKLQQIIAADGDDTVSEDELKLGDEFKKSGKNIKTFLDDKFNELQKAKAEKKTETQENHSAENTAGSSAADNRGETQVTQVEEHNEGVQQESETIEEQPKEYAGQKNAYNQTIQNMAGRYDENELKSSLTQQIPIASGDTLYKIAKAALQAEGIQSPTRVQVNERVAQIAKLNKINNVDRILVGKKIYVGSAQIAGRPQVAATERTPQVAATGQNSGAAAAGQNQEAGDVERAEEPVIAPSSITVTHAPDLTGYQAEDKKDGDFAYKVYTKTEGEGDNAVTSTVYVTYAYEAAFYADSLEELKEQIEVMEIAVKAPEPNGTDYSATNSGYTAGTLTDDEKNSLPFQYRDIDVVKVYTKGSGDTAERVYQIKQGNAVFSGTDLNAVVTNYTDNYVSTLKDQIEITNGNIDVIEQCIYELKTRVDTTNPNVKALVQDLIKTKDAEVISKIISSNTLFANDEASVDLIRSLIQEIVAKENNGEKLTDEEVELKEVLIQDGFSYYTAYDENGICKQPDARTGEANYALKLADNNELVSKDKQLLLNYKTEIATLDSITDANAKAAKAKEIYAKFIEKAKNSGDEQFLISLYTKAQPPLDKETKMELIKVAGARTLGNIDISDFVDDGEFNSAYIARVKELYLSENSKGDLKNLRYLYNVVDKIDDMNKVPEYDESGAIKKDTSGNPVYIDNLEDYVTSLGKELCEAYFTKSEDGTLTFESRRLTYEEMDSLAHAINRYTTSEASKPMIAALLNTIKVEDMGRGQYTAALENYFDTSEAYAELTKDMTNEEIVDFIENKMVTDKNLHIPFNSILERFDATAENKELYTTLMKEICSYSQQPSFANREKLISILMNGDTLEIPEGVELRNIANAFPYEDDKQKFNETTTKVFKATVEKCTEKEAEGGTMQALYNRTNSSVLKELVDNKFISIIQNCTDGEKLALMCDQYPDGKFFAIKNVDANNITTNKDKLSAIYDFIPKQPYSKEDYDVVVNNHWTTPVELKSAKGKKSSNLVQVGEKYYRKTDVYNTGIVLTEVNATGVKAGLDIYGYVKGVNWTGHDANLYTTIKELDGNTVVDAIKEFNRQSKADGESDHIMTWLANEVGPTKNDVNNIPIKLLEWAKAKGLGNSDMYKALSSKIQEGTNDYSENDAKEIDELMEKLIDIAENP